MEATEKLIEELFNSAQFKLKLDEYISKNLKVVVGYDSYRGQYDMPSVFIGESQIEIKINSYGL